MLPLFLFDLDGQSCPATILQYKLSVVNLTWLWPHLSCTFVCMLKMYVKPFLAFSCCVNLSRHREKGTLLRLGCLGLASKQLAKRCSSRSRRFGYHR
jgi:hypothetical protein